MTIDLTAIIITAMVCLTLYGMCWLACRHEKQDKKQDEEQNNGKD